MAIMDNIDGNAQGQINQINESLEKKRLNTYTTFSQINEEYSASNFVYCNMPNNSTLSVSLSAAGGENGFANALIPVSSGGTLFVERIGGRGRIEYCDTSRNVHYAYVSDFSKITSNSNVVWDSYASNSDLEWKILGQTSNANEWVWFSADSYKNDLCVAVLFNDVYHNIMVNKIHLTDGQRNFTDGVVTIQCSENAVCVVNEGASIVITGR